MTIPNQIKCNVIVTINIDLGDYNFMALTISVKGFANGEEIPEQLTCDGENISPEVTWDIMDKNVKSFLLIMDDPDAPKGTFTHWIIYFPYSTIRLIPENYQRIREFNSYVEGRNDSGETRYFGPCPPRGHGFHRYFFRLYALNEELAIRPGISAIEATVKIRGKVVDQATYMGRYKR